MRVGPLASVVVLLTLALSADAQHCVSYSTSAAIAIGENHVVEDCWLGGAFGCYEYPLSLWVYEESNGIDGLQRADEMVDDTCHGSIAGDQIVF